MENDEYKKSEQRNNHNKIIYLIFLYMEKNILLSKT